MATIDKIKLSGTTYDIVDSSAIHSMDGYWTSGQTESAITAATGALAETIAEQHYQTSGDVQNAISGKAEASDVQSLSGTVTAHTANTDIHVTTADKTAWNAKADISDIPSVSGYADSVKYNNTSKYVEFYHGGTGGTKVFEYDASPFLIDGMVQNVEIKDVPITEEATLTSSITSYTFNSGATTDAIVNVTDEWWTQSDWRTTFLAFGVGGSIVLAQENGSIHIDGATATNSGNTIYIHSNNPFDNVSYQGITDLSLYESISAVYGSQTCLVISFNTDAGKQDINIPLTEIFDASNYYTTAQTNSAIEAATSGKADSSAVTEEISAAVSGKANISDVVTNVTVTDGTGSQSGTVFVGYTKNGISNNEAIYEVGSGLVKGVGRNISVDTNTIQEKLTSGTNIKTVGGNSLLGSGDIAFPAGMTAEVSGTTLIFS